MFAYDVELLKEKLKTIQENKNPNELYKTLSEALNELLEELPSDRYLSSTNVINDFINSTYFSGTFPNPGNYNNFVGYAWTIYPKFLRAYSQLNGLNKQDQIYSDNLFKQGIISTDLITSLTTCLEQAKIMPISASQTNASYHSHLTFQPLEEYFNQVNKFLLLEEPQLKALQPVLEELRDPIAACIGSPWKIVNIRSWKTHPRNTQYDPGGGWHSDGFPYDAKKIMLYPKGCSCETGTTQFADGHNVEGPPGTWLLFENSKIIHRAICPLLKENAQDRLIVEITLIPDYKFGLDPVCAGNLAMWPLMPW